VKKSKPKSPMTDPLRKAIVDSELPLLTLAQQTGVARASLIRFVRAETSLHLDVADKLAAYFGLELVKRKVK
jgi:plasmid maintenance system antidote protein VapI